MRHRTHSRPLFNERDRFASTVDPRRSKWPEFFEAVGSGIDEEIGSAVVGYLALTVQHARDTRLTCGDSRNAKAVEAPAVFVHALLPQMEVANLFLAKTGLADELARFHIH